MTVAPLRVEIEPGIVLRPLALDDAAALAATYARERPFFAPYEPERPADWATEPAQAERIGLVLAEAEAGRSVPSVIAAGAEVIGMVNLNNVVRGALQGADLGYWLAQSWNGRGLITRSVESVCAYATALGLHRIAAGTLVDNHRSVAVLQRVGFQEIGLAPAYLRIAGRWQDHRLFQRILHD
ncbi:ribosomal-protein-alanine N-acetyltransferase [Mumia flava]|uniref:Ribosomal-protein-alanine N-acetyltransferase n=1 Tax=Mumia flava TaxID=1348852 RepID=A0A0B2BVF3_9ACTN|nr:GNAT family N-acetyltransferase [Mumia flava]PJJ58008.1 ribosomal-protein-alanine N-acetyltransferase [Mumia flava]